jgi:hypothetical protein
VKTPSAKDPEQLQVATQLEKGHRRVPARSALRMTPFPKADADYQKTLRGLERKNFVKTKFTGEMASAVTGLEGEELSLFMADFKGSFKSLAAFNKFMERKDAKEIEEEVRMHHLKTTKQDSDLSPAP